MPSVEGGKEKVRDVEEGGVEEEALQGVVAGCGGALFVNVETSLTCEPGRMLKSSMKGAGAQAEEGLFGDEGKEEE